MVVIAGCYAPAAQPGSPCVDTPCPSGLVCAEATHTCELANETIDASAPGDGDAIDGAPLDTPAPAACAGNLVVVCADTEPQNAVALGGTIDTDTSPMCTETGVSQPGTCTIVGKTISIANDGVRFVGSKPVVLVAFDTLTAGGPIDVSSTNTSAGAGASSATCMPGAPPPAQNGSPGGSFGTIGGQGGANVASGPVQSPTSLRAGCPGGSIGAVRGGYGGGAIALVGKQHLVLGDKINASGGGGVGGVTGAACGTGGGTGGMIVLDGPISVGSAVPMIWANGGGGGGALYFGDGGNGGLSSGFNNAGDGGSSFGAPGGKGYFNGTEATAGGHVNGGNGGGGGGGAGVIRVIDPNHAMLSKVSPPPS